MRPHRGADRWSPGPINWLAPCSSERFGHALLVTHGGVAQVVELERSLETCVDFDRRSNVGLHHLAFRVPSREALDAMRSRVAAWPGVVLEFAPEQLQSCPARAPSCP
jgi:hypothetical protein